jgi:hypothetical protein
VDFILDLRNLESIFLRFSIHYPPEANFESGCIPYGPGAKFLVRARNPFESRILMPPFLETSAAKNDYRRIVQCIEVICCSKFLFNQVIAIFGNMFSYRLSRGNF